MWSDDRRSKTTYNSFQLPLSRLVSAGYAAKRGEDGPHAIRGVIWVTAGGEEKLAFDPPRRLQYVSSSKYRYWGVADWRPSAAVSALPGGGDLGLTRLWKFGRRATAGGLSPRCPQSPRMSSGLRSDFHCFSLLFTAFHCLSLLVTDDVTAPRWRWRGRAGGGGGGRDRGYLILQSGSRAWRLL
jgi:hypothetical protein